MNRCTVRLVCGHTARLSTRSSAFEFPDDPVWCATCRRNRRMSLEVRNACARGEAIPVEDLTTDDDPTQSQPAV